MCSPENRSLPGQLSVVWCSLHDPKKLWGKLIAFLVADFDVLFIDLPEAPLTHLKHNVLSLFWGSGGHNGSQFIFNGSHRVLKQQPRWPNG